MNKSFLLWACSSIYFLSAKAQLVFTSGNNFVQTGGNVVLTNIDMVNNGTFNPAAGTISFTGTANNTISGTIAPTFNILEINKNTGQQLTLQRNIYINNNINFVSGLIDLSGNNIVLNNTAYLNNESETSRITGTLGGYVQATATLNVPSAANPGNLGAVFTSANNMGLTVIRRNHVSKQNAWNQGSSIKRSYDITPTTAPSLLTLRLNYFDAELNSMSEANLQLVKSGTNNVWTPQGSTSRNTSINYVAYNGITSFSPQWTLTEVNNALPVELLSFKATCKNNTVDVKWTTTGDLANEVFEVQRSSDGIQWQTFTTMPATTATQYATTDVMPGNASLYRLKINAADRTTYSAIRSSGCTMAFATATAYPNPASDELTLQLNNIPDKELQLTIYSNSGQLVMIKNIPVTAGFASYTLPVAGLPTGHYHISLQSAGFKKTLAFVKQ